MDRSLAGADYGPVDPALENLMTKGPGEKSLSLRQGLVIRYDFLWPEEQAAGKQEGVKDRPCVVVAAIFLRKDNGETMFFWCR